jgi:glutaminyl-peptide cyclotransferase
MRALFALLLLPLLLSASAPSSTSPPPFIGYTVEARYPHDPAAFTQGLIWRNGMLYETTGQFGRSDIRRVRLSDGKSQKLVKLPPEVFGEGMTDWKDELISITWQTGVGYRWTLADLKRTKRFRYPGEGWGLTHDDKRLYMSDGTADVRVLDPVSFAERSRIHVSFQGAPIDQLNELEWAKGALFANVWQTAAIVRIDPKSGRVTGVLDLSALVKEVALRDRDAVLNGMAYDVSRDVMLVTGKNWPTLFAIRLAH